tara:strand:- start:55 stop:312 length:258 start_codon:yes stop_codon:yes gene_type:complete
MLEIPIILMMCLSMALFGLIIFAFEYGKQMKELKSLRRELRRYRAREWNSMENLTWQLNDYCERTKEYEEKLDPAIFDKIKKKKK